MNSEHPTNQSFISPKSLSSQGYALCFFPEQPQRKVVVAPEPAVELVVDAPEPEIEWVEHKTVVQNLEATVKPPLKSEFQRLYWRNRLVYLIAFVSYSLSLNNIYHFPINIYRYGSNFFIPYTFATIVIGYPLHVLETSMGQYSQSGVFWMWECAPIFCGVGLAMTFACVFTSFYYNMFAVYSLVYFAHCFSSVFPWLFCDHSSCNEKTLCTPSTWYVSKNVSFSGKDYFYNIILNNPYRYPLDKLELGSFNWWLFLPLLFSWFLIFVAIMKSVRSIGKFVIVIVIFSYFAMLSLLIAAFQLNKGKLDLDTATKADIFDLYMWCAAVTQVVLELGLCFGIPITYGSFCRFRNSCHIDSIILCALNYAHSLIFFYLFFAFLKKSSCNDFGSSWELPDNTIAVIYIIFSEIVGSLPGAYFWCLLMFFMVFGVTITTQIALTETIMTVIFDHFQEFCKFRKLCSCVVCFVFCIFGTIFCFSNAFHGVVILYYIPTFFCAIILVFFFLMGVVFVYGLENYSEDMKVMVNKSISLMTKVFFYFLVILLIFAFIRVLLSIENPIQLSGMTYDESHLLVAWIVCCIILSPVVICGILWVLHCLNEGEKIWRSSNSWKLSQEQRKQGWEQYNTNYSSSHTWEWNKYTIISKEPLEDESD